MLYYSPQETILSIIFLAAIFLIANNIYLKLDPQFTNLINKTSFEKQLMSLRLTLIALILVFLIELAIIELNNYYLLFEGYNS